MSSVKATQATILLVEDDADIRETLAELLEAEGYAVRLASHGVDALEQLQENQNKGEELPAVILLDLMMPVMGGMELVETLRQRWPDLSIPIFMVTAASDGAQQAHLVGVDRVIEKPIDIDVLLAALEKVVLK